MKTARTIEEMEEQKAAKDNPADDRDQGDSLRELTQPMTQKRKRGDASYAARIAPYQWKKGVCPNLGGKPKVDLSAEIARGIFENNQDIIYAAFVKMLKRGNAYAYQVLSDRAYGKMKEKVEVDVGPYRTLPTEDLEARCEELQRQLGLVKALPATEDDPTVN